MPPDQSCCEMPWESCRAVRKGFGDTQRGISPDKVSRSRAGPALGSRGGCRADRGSGGTARVQFGQFGQFGKGGRDNRVEILLWPRDARAHRAVPCEGSHGAMSVGTSLGTVHGSGAFLRREKG